MYKHSALLERILRTKQIVWKDSKITLFKLPVFMSAAHLEVYLFNSLEENIGEEKTRDIMYDLGEFQGEESFDLFAQMYGFSKKIIDKSKFLDFQITQSEIAGRGEVKWVKKDLKNNHFVAQFKSVFAEVYKCKISKKQKAIDHQARGILSKYVERIIGEPCFCIESKCICTGNEYCEFIIKPIKDWDTTCSKYKKQFPNKIQQLKKFRMF
ncbi:hypothetical protein KY321_05070 [Candidatus Woesearchaeota archaeon]|nr:hypothetical protein [Candidatus Woesearchaeota archaeon]